MESEKGMNGWSRLYKAYWTTRWVTNRFSGEANFSQELNDHLWPFGCVISSIRLQSECYCGVWLQMFWRWWLWGMNSNIVRLSALILKLLAIVGLNMTFMWLQHYIHWLKIHLFVREKRSIQPKNALWSTTAHLCSTLADLSKKQ